MTLFNIISSAITVRHYNSSRDHLENYSTEQNIVWVDIFNFVLDMNWAFNELNFYLHGHFLEFFYSFII